MAYFHDVNFINRLSLRLRNFKRRNDVFNFSCPLCGDSKKSTKKARGYIYLSSKKDKFYFRCYNCEENSSFSWFLKKIDPELFAEYSSLGSLMSNTEFAKEPQIRNIPKLTVTNSLFDNEKFDSVFTKIKELPEDHISRQYLETRKIPLEKIENEFYYTDDFRASVLKIFTELKMPERVSAYAGLRSNDSRIVIPFYDRSKKILGFQGRTLDSNNKLRYITIKIDPDSDKVYGLHNIDPTKEKIYVVEGPIDSMFIENSVAVMDSNLTKIVKILPDIPKEKFVLAFDNEPRSKNIVDAMGDAIEKGFSVIIFPSSFESLKDINDIVKSKNMSSSEVLQLLDENTYPNDTTSRRFITHIHFNKWKKVS